MACRVIRSHRATVKLLKKSKTNLTSLKMTSRQVTPMGRKAEKSPKTTKSEPEVESIRELEFKTKEELAM